MKEKEICTLTDDELIEAAHKVITDMCQRKRWQMTVPVDFNRDSDMILIEVINRYEQLLKNNKEMFKDIDKLAEEYADSIDRRLTSYHEGLKRGFKDFFVKYVKPQSEMDAASSVKDKTEQP